MVIFPSAGYFRYLIWVLFKIPILKLKKKNPTGNLLRIFPRLWSWFRVLGYLELIEPCHIRDALPKAVLIFPWGARRGERVVSVGKWGWPDLGMAHLIPCLAGCKTHRDMLRAPSDRWLGGEGLMRYGKLEDFMATLGDGYQFQGPSQGENAPISCGFWREDKFHNSSSQEA